MGLLVYFSLYPPFCYLFFSVFSFPAFFLLTIIFLLNFILIWLVRYTTENTACILDILKYIEKYFGLPLVALVKEPTCQCRRRKRCEFNPCVGKIHWRRVWQPTPVFLPGESCGQDRNKFILTLGHAPEWINTMWFVRIPLKFYYESGENKLDILNKDVTISFIRLLRYLHCTWVNNLVQLYTFGFLK